ncbi:MAG: hypothetical protein ABJA67_05955 [Chthonomonadales bacterium]
MIKNAIAVVALVAAVAAVAVAAPQKNTKVVAVNTCPITGEDSKAAGGGSTKLTIKGIAYKVNFCCAGCKDSFNKMSAADKEKKVVAASKTSKTKKG